MKNYLFGLLFAICLLVIFIFSAYKARAASLYFSPASGNFAVGNIFSVSLLVNTEGEAINNAEALVEFPTEFLSVMSVSQSTSIFSLWVQPVSYSNSDGTITFNGGLPTPGYTGSSGRIFSVVFQVKKAGIASLILSSAAVRANDGKGANILTSAGSVQYILAAPPLKEEVEALPRPSLQAPSAPEISSPTHLDQQKWYALRDVKFILPLPSGVNAARLLIGHSPLSIPSVTYIPPVTFKEFTNMEDGIWYFHAQFRNKTGWGNIAHYRFQIDTVPPKPFIINFIDGKETNNPRPSVSFETLDELSGVDYYKVKIDDDDFFIVSTEAVVQGRSYTLPFQDPGKKTILVQAFDRAGNSASSIDEFIVTALAPPEFTDYPKELRVDEILIAKGETIYPQSQVIVWLRGESGLYKQIVKSGDDGMFVFIAEKKLSEGIYDMWAEVFDERGAKSAPSKKLTITVAPVAIYKILSNAIGIIVLAALFIAVSFILFFFLWRVEYESRAAIKRLRKKAHDMEVNSHKVINALRKDVAADIKFLEKIKSKRELTDEEEHIIKQLEKSLDNAEKIINRKIVDIEKEVK